MSQKDSTQIFFIIYKITNLLNNKIYIGQHTTTNLNDNYFGSGVAICRAFKLHGRQNFKKEILFFCKNKDQLNKKQREIVNEEFVARDDTYNIALGGQNDISLFIAAGKNAMQQILSDPIKYAQHGNKISNGLKKCWQQHGHNWLGKKNSEQTKQKMRNSKKGKQNGQKNSQYGTCWIYNEQIKDSKKIKCEDLQKWISQGWIKGRKIYTLTNESRHACGNSTRNKIWITNGFKNKIINPNDQIPNGWYKGKVKQKKKQ